MLEAFPRGAGLGISPVPRNQYTSAESEDREDRIMTKPENWKEHRDRVERYRALERETTDPLAARLLHDIVADLEGEFERWPKQGIDSPWRI
jgi:hypothetical protein